VPTGSELKALPFSSRAARAIFPAVSPTEADDRPHGVWPRIYRPTRRQRLLMYACGALLFVMGIGTLIATYAWRQERDGILVPFGLACAIGGAYAAAAIRRSHVLLFEDAIEFVELGYGRRRLRRDEIRGLRIIPEQYGFVRFVFELRDPQKKPYKNYLYCERDDALFAWLDTIPNLDIEDQARAAAELLQSPALGSDEAERIHALDVARSIARVMTGLAVAATLWGFFYPRPFDAVVLTLAVIPLLALALLLGGRGRYTATEDRNDVRPSLALPLIMPGTALALRAFLIADVLDWRRMLIWVAIASVALTVLVAVGDRAARRKWYTLLPVPFVLACHPLGVLLMANVRFDRSAPEEYRVAVLDKHISSNKGPNYHLHLAAWGPSPATTVQTYRSLYESVDVGGTVCASLRQGALGIRWYFVGSCDAAR
jgi:hypothetical protein